MAITRPRLALPRDHQILAAVGTLAPASAEDIQRLLFPGTEAEQARRSTARRRLGKLCRLGLGRQLRTGNLADPAWYALTPLGKERVEEASAGGETAVRTLTGLGRMNLKAHRELNRLRISFVLAARAHPKLALRAWLPERELRALAPREQSPLVPDALILFEHQESRTEIALAIELDLGTERHQVLRAKVAAYRALRGAPLFGSGHWLLVFVVPSARRGDVILRLLHEGGADDFAALGVLCELGERTVLAEGWYSAKTGEPVALF